MGTTETLYTNQINDWLEYFLDAISEGMSISQAMSSANRELAIITVPYEKAVWSFMAVDKGNVEKYGVSYSNHDSTTNDQF